MKTIVIRDGMGHMREAFRLNGAALDGEQWVVDLLKKNGCDVDDSMNDDDIAEAVRDAWAGEDYEGDPDENGLTVSVD